MKYAPFSLEQIKSHGPAVEPTGIPFFTAKPLVLFLHIALGLTVIPSVADARSCQGSDCTLVGSYMNSVQLQQFAGRDGDVSSQDFQGRSGTSGSSISVSTLGNTKITQQTLSVPALLINTRGGRGAENTAVTQGGRGGGAGSVTLAFAHDLELQSNARGIEINTRGGDGGRYSTDKNRTPGGAGADVYLSQTNTKSLSASVNPSQANRGLRQEVIYIDSSGGHGAEGRSAGTSIDDGSDAGRAGRISVELPSQLTLTSETASVIKTVSNGGNAGALGSATTFRRHRAGYAGEGAQQTVYLGGAAHKSHIETRGVGVAAIGMQSKGGDGGEGFHVTFGLDGHTTSGARGGDLTLTLKNTQVQTQQERSNAIQLSSIGGAGGNLADGGMADIRYRGNGAEGGNLRISLDEATTILTKGTQSDGVHASSLGGGGKKGRSGAFTSKKGSTGGKGGDITIRNAAAITTQGNDSSAIYAESAGGAAGDAGNSTFGIFGRSASGGQAGLGGKVDISNTGVLQTAGKDSHVMMAQSIGGTRGEIKASDVGQSKAYVLGGMSNEKDDANARADSVVINNQGILLASGDYASAVVAQSIGGGGGAGGSNFGFVVLGGSAGASGQGGTVTVTNNNVMSTQGHFSPTIIAQSIGGGGGLGGTAAGASVLFPSILIGGKSGRGGDGGQVKVENNQVVLSSGDFSNAISAMSIGGGGGMGGNAKGVGALQLSTFNLGAEGGAGGNGNQVIVDNRGLVTTVGANSHAIAAQSIGGGGGMGGNANSVTGAGLSNITLGGRGSVGGTGGLVSIQNEGSLLTSGNESMAIFAQSVGGGGGSGGSASSLQIGGFPAGASGQEVSATIAVGGKGGNGNRGGRVTVNNKENATIRTSGNDSSAVFLQSIGGGGGTGGGAAASTIDIPKDKTLTLKVAVGGDGGKGNKADTVELTNRGSISTSGQLSTGIKLQSVGGGGGHGGVGSVNGFVYEGTGANKNSKRYDLTAAVGGKGDNGGLGGSVILNNASGSIETFGDHSAAVIAQSIGGGGGTAGVSHADSTKQGLGLDLQLGGSGGSGGHGGTVNISNDARILTHGQHAVGIHAQSIGGGGGDGGATGATASKAEQAMYDLNTQIVNLTKKYKDISSKYQEHVNKVIDKVVAKPAGDTANKSKPAATNQTFDTKIALGGHGGHGGNGGNVAVKNLRGSIQTSGELATAILAQSIGGGGGNGGASQAIGTDAKSTQINLSVGGSGKGGGHGGRVEISNSHQIRADGVQAMGIAGQSIGGGGGMGGSSKAIAKSEKDNISLSIGGSGGRGGDAGTVVVTNYGTIAVRDSYAVFAQSVGGGGGAGAASTIKTEGQGDAAAKYSVNLSIGGLGQGGGKGGEVSVLNRDNGQISTQAPTGAAVLAQSIGGGGGAGASSTLTQENKVDKTLNLSLGGASGNGAVGGKVSVVNEAQIRAEQGMTIGILAQSIGGGGGLAGSATLTGKSSKLGANLSLGGNGGEGGHGGEVSVDNGRYSPSSTRLISSSHGIVAQSIGGGGGTAGSAELSVTQANANKASSSNNEQKNLESKNTLTLGAHLASGGNAKSAGDGGSVTLRNSAQVLSHKGSALVAQSIGGGGGLGGAAKSTILAEAEKKEEGKENTAEPASNAIKSTTANLTLGGSGGKGGQGKDVTITNSNTASSHADNGAVILAQSIGGGGGSAGMADSTNSAKSDLQLNFSLGAKGGDGGQGGKVTVNNTGLVQAPKGSTMGIVAQSIGGGGGQVAVTQVLGTSNKHAVNVALGSQAGGGGNGGEVIVKENSSHRMSPSGIAVLAQSIGGGGGLAATATSTLNATKGSGHTLSLALGGRGGNGGDGGKVDIDVNNVGIFMQGNYTPAIVAQSIGGGGGLIDLHHKDINQRSYKQSLRVGGHNAKGAGGELNVRLHSAITTTGSNSHAIIAQSIGGGGGILLADGLNLSSSDRLGGQASNGVGKKVAVQVERSAQINTQGDGSYGVLAQSIGGGGGLMADTSQLNLATLAKSMPSKGNSVSNGDGGDVYVNIDGRISTTGRNSQGVFAQSVTQGGGLSQSGMGGQTADRKGHSGEVKVNIGWVEKRDKNNNPSGSSRRESGHISAIGQGSIGVVAQNTLSANKRLEVNLNNDSSIKARTGVYLVGGDKHSNLSLFDNALIEADTALLIDSREDVSLNLHGRSIIRSEYIHRSQYNGESNDKKSFINLDSGTFASGSIDVQDVNRKVVVHNKGFIDLGPTWNLGKEGELHVDDGGGINVAGSSFGTTSIRGKGYIHLNKNARWILDADFANSKYDHLTAYTYVKLHDGGKMEVNARSIVPGKKATVLTVHANDFSHGKNHKLDVQKNFKIESFGGAYSGSSVISYSRAHERPNNGNILTITPHANFTGTRYFSNRNEDQQSIARYLQNTWDSEARKQQQQLAAMPRMATLEEEIEPIPAAASATPRLMRARMMAAPVSAENLSTTNETTENTPVVAANMATQAVGVSLANALSVNEEAADTSTNLAQEAEPTTTVRDDLYGFYAQVSKVNTEQMYEDVLDNVAADAMFAPAGMMPMHNRQFVNKMYSCDLNSGQTVKNGDTCLWLDGRYNKSNMERDSEDFGYRMNSRIVQVGGEHQLNPNWSVGASIGFDHLNVNAKGIAISTKGDAIVGGVFIKHTEGQRELAASLSTMYGSYKTKRNIQLPTEQLTADSKWKSWLHSLNLHAGYTFPWHQGYIKPSVDVSLMYQRNPAYQEKGAGGLNLNVAKESQWTVMVSPQVEVSQTYESGNYQIRPYASLGASWMSNKNWTSRMQLQGGSQNHWITIKSDLPNLVGNAKAGLNVMHAKGVDVNLEYAHQWGKRYRSSTGWLKVGYQF